MEVKFEFEYLLVWKKSVEFVDHVLIVIDHLDSNRKHYRLLEQIESSSLSIAINIAEGKGRSSNKDYLRFLYYSRGSLYETITILNIFNKRKWISDEDYKYTRTKAFEIVKMLNALISSIKRRL